MVKLSQTEEKVIVEFNLIDFVNLQDLLVDLEKEISDYAGKFQYEAFLKFKNLELDNSYAVNKIRLKKIDEIIKENAEQLKKSNYGNKR